MFITYSKNQGLSTDLRIIVSMARQGPVSKTFWMLVSLSERLLLFRIYALFILKVKFSAKIRIR